MKTDAGIIECKPKGLFRKQGIRPVPGDNVCLAIEAETYYIDQVLKRKNVFIRPPVANIDQLLIVVSTVEPVPSFLVIDKLTAIAFEQDAIPIIIITKIDLQDAEPIITAYQTSGISLIVASAETDEGMEEIHSHLQGKLSVFCGNSGVGKSTLMNALAPFTQRETGEISQKLGRGRHTTREVEIFEIGKGLVADTPGFASLDLQRAAPIPYENLQYDFPEIGKLVQKCRYTGCSHVAETGCAVKQAMAEGQISPSRYESYVTLYQEAKQYQKF